MDDQDELLAPGRAALPKPARIAGAVLLVAALVAVFAVRLWPSSGPKGHQAALGTPPPASGSPTTPSVSRPPQQPWPSAPSACGGFTALPLVSAASRPAAAHTGLTLVVGGRRLRTVDFDTGRATALSTRGPGRRGFVQTLTAGLPGYATTTSCRGGAASELLRIGTNQHVANLRPLRSVQSVLADGSHAWILTTPHSSTRPTTLRPLGGGPVVTMPNRTFPTAIENGTIVASRPTGRGSVVLLNATTGRVERSVPGSAFVLAADAGVVLWTEGCNASTDAPCELGVLRSASGRTVHFPLPRPVLAATISTDGSQVALVMASAGTGPDEGHPLPPSNIADLDLRTGRLQIVPGITIAAKEFPGLAFSADGRWLAMALDAGTRTRLFAWHPGLSAAYETKPVPGRNDGVPPLIALGG